MMFFFGISSKHRFLEPQKLNPKAHLVGSPCMFGFCSYLVIRHKANGKSKARAFQKQRRREQVPKGGPERNSALGHRVGSIRGVRMCPNPRSNNPTLPLAVSLVECHGTGTALGDPIEYHPAWEPPCLGIFFGVQFVQFDFRM